MVPVNPISASDEDEVISPDAVPYPVDQWPVLIIVPTGASVQLPPKLRLPLIKADIGNPKTFYNSRLKKFLRGKVGSTGVAYRTYTLSSIGGLRIIDYRFEGSNFDDEVRAQAKEDK